jgi:hypothetical protein
MDYIVYIEAIIYSLTYFSYYAALVNRSYRKLPVTSYHAGHSPRSLPPYFLLELYQEKYSE